MGVVALDFRIAHAFVVCTACFCSGVLTMNDFYNTYVRQYQHNQFQYWLLLMMASVMKRVVSSRYGEVTLAHSACGFIVY